MKRQIMAVPVARGHRVHIARDAFGRIRITAARMESGG